MEKASGDHRYPLAETAMSRRKELVTKKLSVRNDNCRVGEVMTSGGAMNKLGFLSLPVRKPRVSRSLGAGGDVSVADLDNNAVRQAKQVNQKLSMSMILQ